MLNLNERTFGRLSLAAIVAGFALLIAAFIAALSVFNHSASSIESVNHTRDVVNELSRLEVRLERAETARRGILLWPDAYRRSVFQENVSLLPVSLDRIEQLTADNPRQKQLISELRRGVDSHVAEISASVNLAVAGDGERARQEFVADAARVPTLRRVRSVIERMREEEQGLLESRSGETDRSFTTLKTVLAVTGILLFLIGAATFWLVRRYTVNLTSARDRLNRLNTDLEGAVAERTADLTRANEEIQRFAYIVSHDLRSPLVNMMGFTAELEAANKSIGTMVADVDGKHPELVSAEARLAASEDLPEAIGFIRSATQKMDRLINAILGISREGRRVLTVEQLPMETLINDIVRNLATQAEERGATIVIERPLPNLVHDRLAIEQVFQNLIDNAVKYLEIGKPGTITVRGRTERGRAIFDVEDDGRGIAPADHRRIFELFRRSGAQDQRGEGIGLASVNALVLRLGGYIDVKSELGQGSTFTVNLPIEYREKGEPK